MTLESIDPIFFKQIVEYIPKIVWVANEEGVVEYYNQRWYDFTGMTPKQNEVYAWKEFVHPDDVEPALDLWYKAVTNRSMYEAKYRIRRSRDGQYRWFLGRAFPIQDEDGKITKWFGAATDIHEHVLTEEELRRMHKSLALKNDQLESFNYSISHDLRTPLRAIDAFSQILLDEYNDSLPDEAKKYLNVISSSVQDMGNLIEDLLAVGQLGKSQMKMATVDMNFVVRRVITSLYLQTKGRNINWEISPNLGTVRGDLIMLQQVWSNLISNAIKFTRKNFETKIQIGKTQVHNECTWFIQDNGIGFESQYAEQIFGVFKRLHTSVEFEGTGIGLAFCERVIHLHGGQIWAQGVPDQGATFYFNLGKDNRCE